MTKNINIKKFAIEKTPLTGSRWLKLSISEREHIINLELKKKKLNDFEVFKTSDDGQIVFKVLNPIPSSKRSDILLDLEQDLKESIDKGLTVWFEPIGDKSKLRNLRGIKFQSE